MTAEVGRSNSYRERFRTSSLTSRRSPANSELLKGTSLATAASSFANTLRLTDGYGPTVCQQFVTAERESDRGGARARTVCVTELMHPPDQEHGADLRMRCVCPAPSRGGRSVALMSWEPGFAEQRTSLSSGCRTSAGDVGTCCRRTHNCDPNVGQAFSFQ